MRYVQTLRHLKPVQVYGRVWFRLNRPKMRDMGEMRRRALTDEWRKPIVRCGSHQEIGNWNDPRLPKLALYQLHYFDAPDIGLIQRWISENPRGDGNGWEPYPLSRRIVNWIKWSLQGNEFPQGAAPSLAAQADYLSQRLEYHLLGNHLFVNAKALLFAGVFFEGPHAEKWLAKGLEILAKQIPEQILSDGAHFERSPMYHSLIVEDLLDLVNLRRAYAGFIPDWSQTAVQMLNWLRQMTHQDGEIGFFNDAAFGIAATWEELDAYAERLGICRVTPTERSIHLECGYMRLQVDNTLVLFDAAPIGPDYQPGHAHADTLSLELSHKGRRVLVNSGTSTYEADSERQRQRGTAAHNTIQVDGIDQSEVWGAFRVARRARPERVFFESSENLAIGRAAHDGYRRLASPVTHERTVELRPGVLKITDRLEGRASHRAEIFFHLHPEIEANALGGGVFRLTQAGIHTGTLRLDPLWNAMTEPSTYHPEFGVSVQSQKIVGKWNGSCPAIFSTRLDLQ